MRFEKLGNYVHLIDKKNKDLQYDNVLGININKQFMPSVANLSNTDLSKYKVISKGQFAYSAMQVGRDETIRIALYPYNKPAIISPAYQVIEVNDTTEILPEFIMMWFQRAESDRYGWFISDGSVRASLDFNRLCEIEIPIIPLDEQKKYVSIYNSLLKNQTCYENSLEDLQLICDSYIDKFKNDKNKIALEELVELVDSRNTEEKYKVVMGINVDKVFMSSKANLSNTDLSKYKIISKDEFAYSAMQVGRDETVRVVLYDKDIPVIISPAYSVFKIIDKKLLPEFLMLWFRRPEFNRYGWFLSDGSVRASLDWETFIKIKVPVPEIEVQKAILSTYKILEKRKKLNEKLKESLQPLCPILMKGVRDLIEN